MPIDILNEDHGFKSQATLTEFAESDSNLPGYEGGDEENDGPPLIELEEDKPIPLEATFSK